MSNSTKPSIYDHLFKEGDYPDVGKHGGCALTFVSMVCAALSYVSATIRPSGSNTAFLMCSIASVLHVHLFLSSKRRVFALILRVSMLFTLTGVAYNGISMLLSVLDHPSWLPYMAAAGFFSLNAVLIVNDLTARRI